MSTIIFIFLTIYEMQDDQQKQIYRLGAKYNNVILTSPLNEKATAIINESKVLYTKATVNRLVNMVNEASANNSSNGDTRTANLKKHNAIPFPNTKK